MALLLVLCAAVGASCDSSEEISEETFVKIINDFQDEIYQGDLNKAYAMLDDRSKENCSREYFISAYAVARGISEQYTVAELKIVSLDSSEASVRFRYEEEPRELLTHEGEFSKESGKWRYRVCPNPGDG